MSLQLQGFLNCVPVADEGYYFDPQLQRNVFVPRSGRICKTVIFDLLLGTVAGGLMVQNTVSFGCMGILGSSDGGNENLDESLLNLDGLFNFASLFSALIAQYSSGVILGLSCRMGLYRDDENYLGLCNVNSTGILQFTNNNGYSRIFNGNDVIVKPVFTSDFKMKIPFLGNVQELLDDLLLNYTDKIIIPQSNRLEGNIEYCLGYPKFENDSKNSIVGVICNTISFKDIVNTSNVIVPQLLNNDSVAGLKVFGSENFGDSDYVISEKFIYENN